MWTVTVPSIFAEAGPGCSACSGHAAIQASRETGIMLAFAPFREFVRGVSD